MNEEVAAMWERHALAVQGVFADFRDVEDQVRLDSRPLWEVGSIERTTHEIRLRAMKGYKAPRLEARARFSRERCSRCDGWIVRTTQSCVGCGSTPASRATDRKRLGLTGRDWLEVLT